MWRDKMTTRRQRVSGCDLHWYQLLILFNEDLLTHTECCRKEKLSYPYGNEIKLLWRSQAEQQEELSGVENSTLSQLKPKHQLLPDAPRRCLQERLPCPWWPWGWGAGERTGPEPAGDMLLRASALQRTCAAIMVVLGSCCSKGSRRRIIEYLSWKGLIRMKWSTGQASQQELRALCLLDK